MDNGRRRMDTTLTDRMPALRLDRSRQAVPQIADALRELILSLELPPGTVLPRAELAERFGVSQTPVRDALTQLGQDGLVDIYPQHATIVSRIDVPAALRAHFLRRALELEIVRDLAGRTTAEVAALMLPLRDRIAEQKRALAAKDFGTFTRADHDFHRVLYDAAGMAELWPLIRQRSGHVDRLRRLNLPARGKAQSVLRDHQAIADAIAARQPQAAQDALRKHLAGTLTFVEQVRQRHPDWVIG
jgi:GntR family transcriptional regulator, rspAB operon transcriptional repressor